MRLLADKRRHLLIHTNRQVLYADEGMIKLNGLIYKILKLLGYREIWEE